MSREKHPIHLVAKMAGQLNKVMLAIRKLIGDLEDLLEPESAGL